MRYISISYFLVRYRLSIHMLRELSQLADLLFWEVDLSAKRYIGYLSDPSYLSD